VKENEKKCWTDNYYQRRFGCTRNQYRRIINDVKYDEALDGPKSEYEKRKKTIGDENE